MTPSRPRPGRASGCSAAPPRTSRSPRRSSTRCASSARSATTSATPRGRCCARAARSPTTSSASPAARPSSGRASTTTDLNTRETLVTELNVFEHFEPKLSTRAQECDVLFLANIQPDLQRGVREQCAGARFVAMDSMNLWIDIARDSLVETIKGVDCLILNDEELELLTGEPNLVSAAREVLTLGPDASVVAKQGKYGAALFTQRRLLRPARLPARGRRRPDRRRRQLRRRLRRLRRRARRRGDRPRPAARARWPTAPRSRRSTSRSSAPSAMLDLRPTRSPRASPSCSA